MAKYKQKIKALEAKRRASQQLKSPTDILHSFSDRLSELSKENAQVIKRAQRTEQLCVELNNDIALALSRLAAESTEREQRENRLLRERDELAEELAALKQEAQRQAQRNKSDPPTSTSPTSVVDGANERAPLVESAAIRAEEASSTPTNSSRAVNEVKQEVAPWRCPACTYENSSSTTSCEMCGKSVSAVVEESAPAFLSMLLEMGYKQSDVDEAIQALDGPDKNRPEAVIYWIDEKEEKQKMEQERIKQERVEKERRAKEREANERAALKKAKKEAQEKAQREAEQAEERKARETAERVRREAREAKGRARREAEQAQKEEEDARKEQEHNVRDEAAGIASDFVEKVLASSAPVFGDATASLDKPVVDEENSDEVARSDNAKRAIVKLVRPYASRKASTRSATDVSRLSQYMYSDSKTPRSQSKKQSPISPIFGMLRDESTVESARILLSLESECAKLKKEAAAIRREKEEFDHDIADLNAEEADLDGKLQVRLNRIEARVRQAAKDREATRTTKAKCVAEIKELEVIKKRTFEEEKSLKKHQQNLRVIERAAHEAKNKGERIKEEKEWRKLEGEKIEKSRIALVGKAEAAESRLNAKLKLVEKARDEIYRVKQTGEEEDARFDINNSRNEHDHTFLMVAAQNNDLKTARVCFQLGAKPGVKCLSGLTAMGFAQFFRLDAMVELLAENGGAESGDNTWGMLATKAKVLHPIDWETQLQIADRAAIPADTKLSSEDDSVTDTAALLDADDRKKQFPCFDASLLDSDATNFRRVVLLEKEVYSWFSEADAATRSMFHSFVNRLQSAGGQNGTPVFCHRRFVVGVKREKQFEVLCAELKPTESRFNVPVANEALVVFYSPYVESYINGVSNVGVLLWAVTTESKASRYISLIEAAEFLRAKQDNPEEVFPPHREGVLELGKDMHLLDLMATSIFTGSAMELLCVNIDKNDLARMENEDFIPKKRLLHHEQQLQQAVFRSSEKESSDNQGILSMARPDLSTNLSGGAGTGKTLLLIKKIISEDADKRILVVSRLSRLISFVKSAVDAERDTSNVSFFSYEDLLNHLSRRIEPGDGTARTFSSFNQVHFGDTTGTGASSSINFEKDFVRDFLEEGERSSMKKELVEPITLWGAFRVIKSSAKCSGTKEPLSEEDYVNLPRSFGLNRKQRALVYKLYLRYTEWLETGTFKWDEADRVLYILRWGPSVFAESEFVPWEERAYHRGESGLLDDNDMPLAPFFYHMVFADEAQDFSDLDLALFVRMSSSVRSLFLGADPAQSVELGIRMRVGTVNSVFHSCLPKNQRNIQVKNVLQEIQLRTNHRTHARNLEIGKAVRKILTRSFGVPSSDENALMEGAVPEALLLKSMRDLADDRKFRGGNVVFITPDETVCDVRSLFLQLGIKNDVFGVREAKGLEFPSVALVGFFEHFQAVGSQLEWENVIRWLFSSKGITTTESTEKVQGKRLEDCDYVLSHPELEDQAMMLYTALTRARGHLYFVEIEGSKKRKVKGGLAEFAFRQLQQLRLLKIVSSVDEGEVEMTPQQHKARGVLLVVQAINMSRNQASTKQVKEKFANAQRHFQMDTGNDQHLLDQSNKHLRAILMKRALTETARTTFFNTEAGEYDLQGRFEDVLRFEREVAKFFRLCANDSFLVEEIQEMRWLIEEVFFATPYEIHFGEICNKLKEFES